MANGKRKRKQKVSKGLHGGGGKTRLSTVQKVLLGGGLLARPTPADQKKPVRYSGQQSR